MGWNEVFDSLTLKIWMFCFGFLMENYCFFKFRWRKKFFFEFRWTVWTTTTGATSPTWSRAPTIGWSKFGTTRTSRVWPRWTAIPTMCPPCASIPNCRSSSPARRTPPFAFGTPTPTGFWILNILTPFFLFWKFFKLRHLRPTHPTRSKKQRDLTLKWIYPTIRLLSKICVEWVYKPLLSFMPVWKSCAQKSVFFKILKLFYHNIFRPVWKYKVFIFIWRGLTRGIGWYILWYIIKFWSDPVIFYFFDLMECRDTKYYLKLQS